MNYTDFFGMRTGVEGTGWSRLYVQSGTVTFDRPGAVMLAIVGAGGGGSNIAGLGAGTGGNSGPWGRKLIEIKAGDQLSIVLGAGGASPSSAGNGLAGSVSTVSLNSSVIITAQGGEGGVRAASANATAAAATATIAGADWWTPGLRAGDASYVASTYVGTGGAAVDLVANGLGRSPNQAASGYSVGGTCGGNSGGPLAFGGLLIEDFNVMLLSAEAGATVFGVGRGGSSAIAGGMFAGAAGVASNAVANAAPGGGGGGATQTGGSVGSGGGAIACLRYLR